MLSYEFEKFSNGCYVHPEISFLDTHTPQTVLAIPGMISIAERKLLFNLSAKNYQQDGFIVDAGSFMGASVVSLAHGYRSNPKINSERQSSTCDKKPISSFELGFLPKPANGTDRFWKCGSLVYQFGNSFLPTLKESISPYSDLVELNIGDFNQCSWSDHPIEICFVDVCKTRQLNMHVSAQFMPNLMGGKSFFINQDFFFDRLPWIKITMGYLNEYFDWYGQVFSSSVYKCKKPIPKYIADYDPFTHSTLDECLKLHDMHPSKHLSQSYKFRMSLSRSYLIAMKGKKIDALDYLESVEKDYEHIMDDNKSIDRNDRFRFNRTVRQIKAGIY